MALLGLRLMVLLLCLLVSVPVSSLDFESEIRRQERKVKVDYKRAPRTVASFYRRDPRCLRLKESLRLKCNYSLAAQRFERYQKLRREAERRRQAQLQTGDVEVSLESKSSTQ